MLWYGGIELDAETVGTKDAKTMRCVFVDSVGIVPATVIQAVDNSDSVWGEKFSQDLVEVPKEPGRDCTRTNIERRFAKERGSCWNVMRSDETFSSPWDVCNDKREFRDVRLHEKVPLEKWVST